MRTDGSQSEGCATLVPLRDIRSSPDWRQWCDLTADAPPYLSPAFLALLAPLAEGGEPLVAVVSRDGKMIGALPLVRRDDRLEALRVDHSPGYDYCGTVDGLDRIWRGLLADRTWTELALDRVPASSLLATHLATIAHADGSWVSVRPDSGHPSFDLPGFEERMNHKFRANVRRCGRKAGELGLERIAVPTRTAFDEAMAIEAMAWKGAAGTSLDADPRVAHLYRALTVLLGRKGRAAVYFLRAEGTRIATLFTIEDARTLYALKIGFDPRHASVSPGHLMVWKVATDAEQRGLQRLDFVGREDDWKRRWTDLVNPRVKITIYRRSARGAVRYSLREVVKPRLPEHLRDDWRSPLPRRCQNACRIGVHSTAEVVHGRIIDGLGLRSGIKRALGLTPAPQATLGEPSKFAPGSWVRVLDEARVRATLDDKKRLRGLAFVPTQWLTCGEVFRVQKHVRRIRDDHGQFRPVTRSVLLENVDCGGNGEEPMGCGRFCPLWYRDEWLEPAAAPVRQPPAPRRCAHARVRSMVDIRASLDLHGRRDGLTFLPEMAAYAGRRLPVRTQVTTAFELDRWTPTRRPIYFLRGLHCAGAVTGHAGPCDRACALMWHEDWLLLEPARPD